MGQRLLIIGIFIWLGNLSLIRCNNADEKNSSNSKRLEASNNSSSNSNKKIKKGKKSSKTSDAEDVKSEIDEESKATFELVEIVDEKIHLEALKILTEKCASCHDGVEQGNFSTVLDIDAMVRNRMVVPGNALESKLFIRSSDDTMPPENPLTEGEQYKLQVWIDDAIALNSTKEILPAFIPEGASEQTKSALLLLNNRCVSCHNEASGDSIGGFIKEMLDPAQMKIAGLIVPGNAAQSPLNVSISAGRMPLDPATKAPSPLSNAEVQLLQKYIDELPSNPEKLPSTTALRPLSGTFTSIRENIIASRCSLCHGGALGTRDGVSYNSYAATLQSITPENSFLSECSSGSMPDVYEALTAQELGILSDWMDLGAPDN